MNKASITANQICAGGAEFMEMESYSNQIRLMSRKSRKANTLLPKKKANTLAIPMRRSRELKNTKQNPHSGITKILKYNERQLEIPQKPIWIRRKPSAAQGCPAITGAEPSLNSDEPKKLRPINQASIVP